MISNEKWITPLTLHRSHPFCHKRGMGLGSWSEHPYHWGYTLLEKGWKNAYLAMLSQNPRCKGSYLLPVPGQIASGRPYGPTGMPKEATSPDYVVLQQDSNQA
ncbi:uncharacterized protein VTP21DRAFT_2704 [Calcarisporiella thermophila]|uniref:uncharacterized protein n=1 Tax=Calcarisporiella thermophila TaxID=911321 RepID=UPI00374409E9